MSREQDNKAIVGRWFEGFWGNPCNPEIIDELAAPDMLLQYSLHAPRRGREDVRNFMEGFRAAFPDLNFRPCPTSRDFVPWRFSASRNDDRGLARRRKIGGPGHKIVWVHRRQPSTGRQHDRRIRVTPGPAASRRRAFST
jgi:hypothetical protein